MDIPPLTEYREELKEISRIIDAPDLRPRKLMTATRGNQSNDWNEQEDLRRFDANLDDYLVDFDTATERLASNPGR